MQRFSQRISFLEGPRRYFDQAHLNVYPTFKELPKTIVMGLYCTGIYFPNALVTRFVQRDYLSLGTYFTGMCATRTYFILT